MQIIEFLIFFPFVIAAILYLLGNSERVYPIRKFIVKGAAFLIMAAVIYLAVRVLRGQMVRTYLEKADTANDFVMAGELFLMCLVTFYSFRFRKILAALLSWIGTIPILWLELSGRAAEGTDHFKFDNLTVLMCLVVGIVGGFITIYAIGYIKDYHLRHPKFPERSNWFLAMLFVFLGAMFGLLFSDNLGWIYFFWEITSVCSFLLIGYNREKESIENSFKALWMNLLGGDAFMAGILYASLALHVGTLSDLQQVDNRAVPGVMIVVSLLAFAALTKSAQLPFNGWLLGAMVAPTPTSALLHSATMVKAGVYLLIRLAPLMQGTLTGVMVTLIGGFTFFAASLMAIATSDGKRVLAHSTVSNLGLIVACAGVGRPESVWAGTMLILFHAVSKSLMFMTVGAVENASGSRNIEDMHGLIVKLPRLAVVMIIGICGMYLAPFGMLVAKWAALKSYIDSGAVWLVLFLVFGTASTSFYWGKWLGKIFAVIHKSQALKDTTHNGEWQALYPLAAMVIAMCFGFPLISNYIVQPVLNQMFHTEVEPVIGGSDIAVMLLMLILVATLPVAGGIISRNRRGITDQNTRSYMSGINAGDDRHFLNAYGDAQPLYMANWYMIDLIGELKIMKPCLAIAAGILVIMLTIIIGGAI
jgi:ech hydrogenase subunit A